jgi:Ca-activated chloride channel family protein
MYCGNVVNMNVPCEEAEAKAAEALAKERAEIAKRVEAQKAEQAVIAKKRKVTSTIVTLIVLMLIAVAAYNIYASTQPLTQEQAEVQLDKLYNNINVHTADLRKGHATLETENLRDILPDISVYPPQVTNATHHYVEIFSSTEKAGSDTDGWLVEAAERFNRERMEINGQIASVMIRGIDSGVGYDYIISEKHMPHAFSPSNELWGEMLKSNGAEVSLVEKRLVGNVAGVLFSNTKNQELIDKYGEINLKNITKAVINDDISMGYTNPFRSSSGLNYLMSTLKAFDEDNPLSNNAVNEFELFQTKVPFVSYTTLQMRDAAQSGALDGFILEYQSYFNRPEIKAQYTFTPYGVRHDSPVYSIGELSDDEDAILKAFIEFCKTDELQKLATDYGFNNHEDYKDAFKNADGNVIAEAQKLWKEKKHGDSDVAVVFIADVSGSMMGEPLTNMKDSLIRGSSHISSNINVGLVSFCSDVNLLLPIREFDMEQRAYFNGAVGDMRANGATAMYNAIVVGMKMLLDEVEKNPNVKPMLFVLTDGETNVGLNLHQVERVISALKIPVHTIGYNIDIAELQTVSNINEAASINAESQDVVYLISNLFNAFM